MISRRTSRYAAIGLAFTLSLGAAVPIASACTRIFLNEAGGPYVVARSMDWATTTEPVLTVLPRGMARDGSMAGPHAVFPSNPMKWTSKYGSVVTTIYGVGTADGINEKGLAAHMLYFPPADFGARDEAKPGIQSALWAQYVLDNSATVAEAIENVEKVQIILVEVDVGGQKQRGTVHLAIEDAAGDSAVLEYIDGKLVVYHGPQYKVMTNAPAYNEQLKMLAERDFANPTMETDVPGNVNPRDRFQRASYYLSTLTKPGTERAAIAGMFTLIRSVSIPFGAPVNDSTFDTEYRVVSDLSNKRYYFELTTGPNVVWIDVDKLNLDQGAPAMTLDPHNDDLTGNVTDKFQAATAPF
ncbi:linear amide C-N hydrolase [Xanthobacter autotrophicus DSM 597]|uniref:linear amide C-N hydrolase n=1 Tax=Xanthobacteraceae TaxID=335928 RepID=UPI00372A0203